MKDSEEEAKISRFSRTVSNMTLTFLNCQIRAKSFVSPFASKCHLHVRYNPFQFVTKNKESIITVIEREGLMFKTKSVIIEFAGGETKTYSPNEKYKS